MGTYLSIGSGPGISSATAERFAREGFLVVLSARNLSKTRALAQLLSLGGDHEVHARTVDAGSPTSVALLVAEVQKSFGTIDVLHYNAACQRQAGITDQPRETFNEDLAVNIGGALVGIQAVIPAMSARRSGTILLTGGGYSLRPNPDYLSLSIGKAGIRAVALALFETLAQSGIHIATVTVAASVTPGSDETHAAAEHFWALYNQPRHQWTAETTYTPE